MVRFFLVCALLFLAACSREAPLVVAFHPFPGYAPAYVAETLPLWPRGVIATRHTSSASESITLLREGKADAALLTLDETLSARASGLPLKVVLIVDRSLGADVLLCRQPLRDLAALRGLRIGHEASGVSELLTQAALRKAGLRYADIRPVHAPFDRHEALWRGRQVDCLATFHPVSRRLEEAGAYPVFDSREAPELIWDVLAVREEALASKKHALETFVAAWFQALRHLRSHEEDTRWRLAPWLGVREEAVFEAYAGLLLLDARDNRRWLAGHAGSRFQQVATQLAQRMQNARLLFDVKAAENIVESAVLPDDIEQERSFP